VKYCPNPECPHLIRRAAPAEFLDRAKQCNDCGAPLVSRETLGTADAGRVVAEWNDTQERVRATSHPYRDASQAQDRSAAARRLDIATGIVLLVLSVGLFFGSYALSLASNRGAMVIAVGPFIYGIVRLGRGLASRE